MSADFGLPTPAIATSVGCRPAELRPLLECARSPTAGADRRPNVPRQTLGSVMKVFAFDPAEYREQFLAQEWIHIKNGIDPEFLDVLQRYARERLEATRLQGFGIKGKKEQSLFELPPGIDYPGELFDVVSELCGLDRAGVTLSERHIQDYDE